jgi:hypothetical protein
MERNNVGFSMLSITYDAYAKNKPHRPAIVKQHADLQALSNNFMDTWLLKIDAGDFTRAAKLRD